ncbi:MAG: hypothetical protein LDL31_03600 [Prosthecobacter sp.]|jgi:hypothetical protein|nr:hypothetical protein [Prosthecobacter sp.]
MPLEMRRHPCGIIYTKDFADYLRDKERREAPRHPGKLLSLEYVSCAEGEIAGTSWWQLDWIPTPAAPPETQLRIGETPVAIHRQSRRGLKNRLLHFANGSVIVRR